MEVNSPSPCVIDQSNNKHIHISPGPNNAAPSRRASNPSATNKITKTEHVAAIYVNYTKSVLFFAIFLAKTWFNIYRSTT